MVEIFINNQLVDFENEKDIKYSIQINDLFNLANVNASYLDAVDLLKTPRNTQILQGLGLIGSTSRVPYQKVPIEVKYYGMSIIKDGWLIVKEVNDTYYKIQANNGIVDFFKSIENRTIGNDLDLSESEHDKTVDVVANSQNNNIYRYFIADYGGKTHTNNNHVNIDYLTPSIKASYLLDKVSLLTGYQFIGDYVKSSDFLDLWLTYPKAPNETANETSELVGELSDIYNKIQINYRYNSDAIPPQKVYAVGGLYVIGNFTFKNKISNKGYFNDILISDIWQGNNTQYYTTQYNVSENGVYKFEIDAEILVRGMSASGGYSNQDAAYVEIWINNNKSDSYISGYENVNNIVFFKNLNANDVVYFKYYVNTSKDYYAFEFNFKTLSIKISSTDLGDVSFEDALSDFSITDWFKDLLWRCGGVPIIDNYKKTIYIQPLKERINRKNAIDWSSKYIRRTSQNSNTPTFAQRNIFSHKYNGDVIPFNDGVFNIDNALLDAEKTILSSKIYSGNEAQTLFYLQNNLSPSLPQLPIWQSEVKQDGEQITTTYKSLTSRFYYIKPNEVNANITLESELLNERQSINKFYTANTSQVYFIYLVPKYYDKHIEMLNNFMVVNIDLNLSLIDLMNVDLSKIYYFEQEANFFILNKLNWSSNGSINGEFIRVIV